MMRSRLVFGSGFSFEAIINATGNSTVMMIENYPCIRHMASRRVERRLGPLCRSKDWRILLLPAGVIDKNPTYEHYEISTLAP